MLSISWILITMDRIAPGLEKHSLVNQERPAAPWWSLRSNWPYLLRPLTPDQTCIIGFENIPREIGGAMSLLFGFSPRQDIFGANWLGDNLEFREWRWFTMLLNLAFRLTLHQTDIQMATIEAIFFLCTYKVYGTLGLFWTRITFYALNSGLTQVTVTVSDYELLRPGDLVIALFWL